MAAVGTLTQLVIQCADARALADFWRRILDLPDPTGDDGWITLEWAPVGRLTFHEVPGYEAPSWPGERGEQHAHLDLLVADLEEATARVLDAGARPLTEVQNPGPKGWRVFADPQGHPFCLVSVPE